MIRIDIKRRGSEPLVVVRMMIFGSRDILIKELKDDV